MLRRLPHLACAVVAGLLFAHAPLAAQGGAIVGTVTAEDGQPLSGAQVMIAGTTLGAVSNPDGRYVLPNVPSGTHTVVVQFIGYREGRESNVQVQRGETVQLDFVLRTQALSLEGVVVTGVADPIEGVKIPFAVGKVKQEDISTVPTTQSALAALQGKVAGVNIVRGSGQPGQGVSILLRTPTSIQTSNTPMFVVDGVIMGSQFGNTTADLESLDIESVEVVKGAAAASLYGSRAASGVIQITTARGSQLTEGTTQIDVRTEMGISQGPQDYPLSKHHHYVTNEEGEWLDEDGNVTTDLNRRAVDFTAPGVAFIDNEYGVPLYNNIERFFKPDLFTTQSVSLAQNTRSTNFRLSMNNYRERGSLENNDGYWRRNVRLNIDHRVGDDVNVSGTIYHNRSKQDDLSGSPFWDLLMYPAEVDLGKTDSLGNYLQQPDETVFLENPIWRQASRDNFDERARTMGNLTARYSPFNWLSFTGQASYDRADIQSQVYVPKGTPLSLTADNPSDGQFSRGETTAQTINASFSANLLKSFGDLTA
ncbi:MAG: carboxypeptidase-like regulatory domain-containing protein, partial [Gemmatimonadota bacterium]